jgi:hypothetical protein
MANNEIKLKITIDNKEAVASLQITDDNIKELYQSFKYGQKEVNGFTTSVARTLNNAREIFQGVREAYSALQMAFGSMLKAYGEQELNEIKLQTALKQTGNYTDQTMQELKNYASTLQSVTLYGDEAYLSVFGMLQAMGLSVEQTKQAALQTANLASLMGTDLSSAARVMGDLFNGDATMINRYIKGLDETIIKSGNTAQIIEYLNTRIGGQAEAAANSGAGAIVQMNNALSDVQENAGMLISKGLNPVISAIRDFITWLNNTHPVIGGTVFALGTLGAALVALQVTGIAAATSSLITGLIPAIKSLFTTVALWSMYNPFTAALIAVAALAAGIAAVVSAQKSHIEEVQENINLNIEDNNLQKQKIQNNISQINTENQLIAKANELYTSVNKLKEGTKERTNKENELKSVLNKLMELNPSLINSNNSFAESMNILNRKRQENINKEREYQTELENTITKLKELRHHKFWADYTEKVNANVSTETLLGTDSDLTKELKKAAYTGSIDDRIKNLETLRNKSTNELIKIANANWFNENNVIKFKQEVNELLQMLYNQKKYFLEESLNDIEKNTNNKIIKPENNDHKNNNRKEQEFNRMKEELQLAETHKINMAEIEGRSNDDITRMKIAFYYRMIDLYKQYGKNTNDLTYQIVETEARATKQKQEDDFNRKKEELDRLQNHKENMAQIEEESEEDILQSKIDYFNQLIDLYKQYNKDIEELVNQRNEIEARRNKLPQVSGKAPSDYINSLRNDISNYVDEFNLDNFDFISEQYDYKEQQLDDWYHTEYEKYANDEEAKFLLTQSYSWKKIQLAKDEEKVKQALYQDTYAFIANGFAQHTAMSKAATLALIYMHTSEAVMKAWAVGGPFLGPVLAAIVTAAGYAQAAKVLDLHIKGFAEGGRLPAGEVGFVEGYRNELIAPEKNFVDIMRHELIPQVIQTTPINNNFEQLLNKHFEKIDNWQKNLTFKLERGDLYSSWEQEDKFRKRNS